jgi:hypothetical protein
MKRQTKHLLSLALTLAMLVGTLSTGSLALEQESAQQSDGQSAAIQGEEQTASLQETSGKENADQSTILQVEPAAISLTYSQAGAFATGKDGALLYKAPVSVSDEDQDGQLTIHDAFVALHQQYYTDGASGYADTGSGWVSQFWGDSSGNLSYAKNHGWVGSVMDPIQAGDQLDVFTYADTVYYSDLYLWFPQGDVTAKAGVAQTFTVQGISLIWSYGDDLVTAIPAGASVTVYNAAGQPMPALSTTTDENGSFVLTFPSAGSYTVEVGGTCSYIGLGFDGSPQTYSDAPVVPVRCAVRVTSGGSAPVTSSQTASTVELPFLDVTPQDFFYEAVRWAVVRGITSGTASDTFAPEAGCTRAQIVTCLWRAAGSPEPVSAAQPFADVAEDAYYAKAVQWAVENGITGGTSATTFGPEEQCTRSQMVTFLYRLANTPETEGNQPFADVAEDAYYAKAVQWAVENGITSGTSATTFGPDEGCTRGQMVTFLHRALGA